MVDALREVHRVLVPRGLLVDARPDSRLLAHVEHLTERGARGIGTIATQEPEKRNDLASDRAVKQVVRERLFRSRRRGRFWHRIGFASLGEVNEYLSDSLRFARRARWTIDAAARRRVKGDRFAIRRPIRFELLDRL